MSADFDTFTPRRPPEEMLDHIRRRFRRRRSLQAGAGAALVLVLAVAAALAWRSWPLPSAAPAGRLPLVREVRHQDRPVPYTLLRLKSGATVVIIHPTEEDKS